MYNVRMKPYEGDENYIFVSYAHADSDFVLPIIDNLHELGYRLWFDDGIEASAEWPEFIEEHLDKCAAVLAFVTDTFVERPNCRKEIIYALNCGKPLLYATPEPVSLGKGLSLQLADQQCIDMSKMTTQRFYQKLAETHVMENCRWKAADGTEIKPHKKRRRRKKNKQPWTLGRVIKTVIISIIVFIAICLIIDGVNNNNGSTMMPTEMAHTWTTDASGVSYCETCGVQTGELEGEQKTLVGAWSTDKVSLSGSNASYFVPNAAIRGCREMTMNIKADSVKGNPYGKYLLYGRDLLNNWKIIDSFMLTDEAEKKTVSYHFEKDEPIDFTGLAIVLEDSSILSNYNIDYTITYTGVIIDQ